MPIETPLPIAHQLDHVAAPFAYWRPHRSHASERIPQGLWDQAAALARKRPYRYVAKPLRLSPSDLKKPMAAQHHSTSREPVPTLSFAEVLPAPEHPVARSGTAIELLRADGARLHRRSDESTLPLAALVRACLEAS